MSELFVACPKCKRVAGTQPGHVLAYYDPRFKCRFCDWQGPIYIVNRDPGPEPESLLELFLARYKE
jgi:hypothetical protein